MRYVALRQRERNLYHIARSQSGVISHLNRVKIYRTSWTSISPKRFASKPYASQLRCMAPQRYKFLTEFAICTSHAICPFGTRLWNLLRSNKVLQNIEIFDFVIFFEVLISYRNGAKRSYIAFEQSENISHEREQVYRQNVWCLNYSLIFKLT